ncbi:MAG: fused MFS/spermidine synthase [Fuerstiella sp.]
MKNSATTFESAAPTADTPMIIPAEAVVAELSRPSSAARRWLVPAAVLLGTALLSSGAAGLINQVIWQRALKVFLGGSETVCSTVVVLVFMAGLGTGSWWSGRRASGLHNPLATFGRIELLLGIVNLVICAVLTADLSQTVFAVQQTAVTLGVPLLLMYAVGAMIVLSVPCFLMGATMPLAAEVCQRNLGLSNSKLLGWLLFINTMGSVAGAVVSSGYMLPELGLSTSLAAAAFLNLTAGLLLAGLMVLTAKRPVPEVTDNVASEARTTWLPGRTDLLALGLGFCSLAYEIHLFRLMPLKQQPLPFTFAAVLSGFLLFWSLGAALSARRTGLSVLRALQLCAAGCVLSIAFAAWDSYAPITGVFSLAAFVAARSHFFLPCVLFGYLFGRVTEEAAKSWGRDVGRIYVWNTVGSCLGILLMTFVGYEIPFFLAVVAVALVLLSLRGCLSEDRQRHSRKASVLPLSAAVVIVITCLSVDTSRLLPGNRLFCGRDGVIVVRDNGEMIWDGLWHSSMSDGTSHIGTHNWHLAVMPAVCHAETPIRDVCVIGVGTGITAATLAKLDTVRTVDAYDISRVLEDVFAACPDGTLNITSNPRINLIWQDARSGLELNPTTYDLIQTQPLYLKQAGSGLLNSEEFMALVSRRLKPGGVFCLYSNGTPEQAFVVRETADKVFPYRETFFNGYLVILSNDPISIDAGTLRQRLASDDPFWKEVSRHHETASPEAILALQDTPELPRHNGALTITDDRPIVEYPAFLRRHFLTHPLPFELPAPDSSHSLKTAGLRPSVLSRRAGADSPHLR